MLGTVLVADEGKCTHDVESFVNFLNHFREGKLFFIFNPMMCFSRFHYAGDGGKRSRRNKLSGASRGPNHCQS